MIFPYYMCEIVVPIGYSLGVRLPGALLRRNEAGERDPEQHHDQILLLPAH